MNPFAGKAVNSSGGEYEIPEGGTHTAALVAIIDLGTQVRTYQGEQTITRRAFLVWELNDSKEDGTNHLVGRDYTLSFHKKSGLRELAESIRGKPYGDDENIDYLKMLGVNCLVTVEVATSKAGSEYAKVKSVTKSMKGTPAFRPQRKPVSWFLGQEEEEIPEWCPYVYGQPAIEVIRRAQELSPAMVHQQPGGNGRKVVAVAEDESPF